MNCNEAGTLVARYVDGEIDDLQRRSIEEHLRGCAACAAKHQQLLALRALANRSPTRLAAVSADPVGGWRHEDPDTIRGLAALELRAAGIRLRPF